jgi:hypothetical protein
MHPAFCFLLKYFANVASFFRGSTVLTEPKPSNVGDVSKRFFEIWLDSLGRGSAHRKDCVYTGQHNAERRGQTSITSAGHDPSTKRPSPTLDRVAPLTVYIVNIICLLCNPEVHCRFKKVPPLYNYMIHMNQVII